MASHSWLSRSMLIVRKLLTWFKAFVHRHLMAVMVEGYMFLRINYFRSHKISQYRRVRRLRTCCPECADSVSGACGQNVPRFRKILGLDLSKPSPSNLIPCSSVFLQRYLWLRSFLPYYSVWERNNSLSSYSDSHSFCRTPIR